MLGQLLTRSVDNSKPKAITSLAYVFEGVYLLWILLRKSLTHPTHFFFNQSALPSFDCIILFLMFEFLLETVINKTLGTYIQDLDSKDLNVSIWSGDIKLTNVKLRTDIF